ncbi:TIMELESS-interacting protein-like isoform X1 [Arapaima gigas]
MSGDLAPQVGNVRFVGIVGGARRATVLKRAGMCDADDHLHVAVAPRYADLDEEERCAVPPPPVRPSPGAARPPPRSLEEHPVGGLLLTCIEDKPMEERRIPDPSLLSNVKKLVSEKGLLTLYSTFENICFKGQGHEVQDLETLLEVFEGWARQLDPHCDFEDLVTHLERMGRLSQVQTCWEDVQHNLTSTHGQTGHAENGGPGEKNMERTALSPLSLVYEGEMPKSKEIEETMHWTPG